MNYLWPNCANTLPTCTLSPLTSAAGQDGPEALNQTLSGDTEECTKVNPMIAHTTRDRTDTIDGLQAYEQLTQSSEEDAIEVSTHAALRWVQRTRAFEQRPQQAWRRSDAVRLEYGEFDRVRYDTETDTLLCAREKTLVTVLNASYEQFEPISRIQSQACSANANGTQLASAQKQVKVSTDGGIH